jgi:hypothetical protein
MTTPPLGDTKDPEPLLRQHFHAETRGHLNNMAPAAYVLVSTRRRPARDPFPSPGNLLIDRIAISLRRKLAFNARLRSYRIPEHHE